MAESIPNSPRRARLTRTLGAMRGLGRLALVLDFEDDQMLSF